jgi:hypothetical protein
MNPLSFQSNSSRISRGAASRAGVLAACGIIVVLDLALFWKSLELYFIQDDFWYLWFTSDQSIRGFAKLFTTQNVFYRPISNFLYFFVLQTVFGTNPFPYHLANLLVHVLNSLAVGYLVYLLTEHRLLAFASAVIFTSRVGHVIAVYWICVTTQSMPLMFFLLSLILYVHYRKNDRPGLLVASYLSFALCAFSNINGPSLVVLFTVYDVLVRRDRSLWSVVSRESGFYVTVAMFLFLQFIVFEYAPTADYSVSVDWLALKIFGMLNAYAFNSLYLIGQLGASGTAMATAGIGAGLATISVALVVFITAGRRESRPEGRVYLFFGIWYIWGFVPYLPLTEHVWPQYITTASVGLAFVSAGLLTRFLRARTLAATLCLILILSSLSIRIFEREEYETKGIIYKSKLARNVISDLREHLERQPHVERVVILNARTEIWWILHYGRNAELFVDRLRPIFYPVSAESIVPDSTSLVLRFEGMHLYEVQ